MADSEGLPLFSDGLLSRWGFGDGDIPEAFMDWLDENHPELDYRRVNWKATLCLLVRRFLLPNLNQSVEVMEIGTIHNPIRAISIDGRDVQDLWYGPPQDGVLTPDAISIPYPVVFASLVLELP